MGHLSGCSEAGLQAEGFLDGGDHVEVFPAEEADVAVDPGAVAVKVEAACVGFLAKVAVGAGVGVVRIVPDSSTQCWSSDSVYLYSTPFIRLAAAVCWLVAG